MKAAVHFLNGPPANTEFVRQVELCQTGENAILLPRDPVRKTSQLARLFRELITPEHIRLFEQSVVVYFDRSFRPVAWYRHSKGGIDFVAVDKRLILHTGLLAGATAFAICHNHPSGSLHPSEADQKLTRELQMLGELAGIVLLDHIILTAKGHFSFADKKLLSKKSTLPDQLAEKDPAENFVRSVQQDLQKGLRHNKKSLEKLAATYGEFTANTVKELTELAIVREARLRLRHYPEPEQKFRAMKKLYAEQARLSHRTSTSTMLQQYSTPAPIAWLAGWFCGIGDTAKRCFEPSAGNGMLTIGGSPDRFTVNEIDEVRRTNLLTQGFGKVLDRNAAEPHYSFHQKFDAVLTNPPFGTLPAPIKKEGFPIAALEHAMCIYALDTLKDSGRAALIIGGHNRYDKAGRLQKGRDRYFFNYLCRHYHVADTIEIKGELYSRMGTRFPIRLILIGGRKSQPEGAAPLEKDNPPVVGDFDELFSRVRAARETIPNQLNMDNKSLEELAAKMREQLENLQFDSSLDGPYRPKAQNCRSLETVVPDSMDAEVHRVLDKVRKALGKPFEEYVRERLGYSSKDALCAALSAEQVDAVALAMYNVEYRGQGMIIGDQTGIGKGRVAAAMIRYAVARGLQPVFITEKPNLFTDLYRDLKAIGSGHLVPFIVNARSSRSHIKDPATGEVVYRAAADAEQMRAFEDQIVPEEYHYLVTTYSQFATDKGKSGLKRNFLQSFARDNLLIMDESHNASGSSQTGEFLQRVLAGALGTIFLSATYAKRPDNLPLYAMKTAIADANIGQADLVATIKRGGVALQEILSSQLVEEGQLLRRERSFEGVEVNYIYLDRRAETFGLENKEQEHRATADSITAIMRGIIAFQRKYITPWIQNRDKNLAKEGKEITKRGGTSNAGIDNPPYFSKIFMVINQMLMAIKAESVARLAIRRLEEGRKPVIAFASTMESFFDDLLSPEGLPVEIGDTVRADFGGNLLRGLDGVLRVTETGHDGEKEFYSVDPGDISSEARADYQILQRQICRISSGITVSPIDHIRQRLQQAGYSVAEVTGRKRAVELDLDTLDSGSDIRGKLVRRPRENVSDAFRRFNDNEVDVLMINQSGSTGASAHALPTEKVPPEQVRQRVMIVLQAELDINTEIQKRGRINRTGQILKPVYDYVISTIPAESRLMMMLQSKLRSLDANTSSNQKNSESLLSTTDFLNKYGDHTVINYLMEHPGIEDMLANPLTTMNSLANISRLATGRVAVLSTEMQEQFYSAVLSRYAAYVEQLRQEGLYDLEVEVLDLRAKTLNRWISAIGAGSDSVFSTDTWIEETEVRNLKKPFTRRELKEQLQASRQTEIPREQLVEDFEAFIRERYEKQLSEAERLYQRDLAKVPAEDEVPEGETKEDFVAGRLSAIEKLETERDRRLQTARRNHEALKIWPGKLFKKLYVGKALLFADPFEEGVFDPGVFLGFYLDMSRDNPYAPSSIRLRFALANSTKYLVLPAGNDNRDRILGILSASESLGTEKDREWVDQWDELTAAKRNEWQIRHIVTGNLLRGFSRFLDEKGTRLVSYTHRDGSTHKGILLPEKYKITNQTTLNVQVPIGSTGPFFRDLKKGDLATTAAGVVLMRSDEERFAMLVPASRSKGGIYYQNPDLLSLVETGNFNLVSNKMKGYFSGENLSAVLNHLQEQHKDSLELSPALYGRYRHLFSSSESRKLNPLLKKLREGSLRPDIDLLEMEARALAIRLSLLSFSPTNQAA